MMNSVLVGAPLRIRENHSRTVTLAKCFDELDPVGEKKDSPTGRVSYTPPVRPFPRLRPEAAAPVLTVGRYSCIASNHGAILHRIFATKKPFDLKFRGWRVRARMTRAAFLRFQHVL
jgi:hypothetical protein